MQPDSPKDPNLSRSGAGTILRSGVRWSGGELSRIFVADGPICVREKDAEQNTFDALNGECKNQLPPGGAKFPGFAAALKAEADKTNRDMHSLDELRMADRNENR